MPPAHDPSTPPDQLSEQQRMLFAHIDEGFAACEMLYDKSGAPCDYRFLEVNDAFERQTGLQGKTILGKTVLELFPDVERTWIERFGKVAQSGVAERFEAFNHNTGRHYETFAWSPEKSRFLLLIRDVTDRKRMETALRESEARLRLALEVGNMATWNSNYETGEFVWDSAMVRRLGYAPGTQASYERWTRRVHPEDLPGAEAAVRESVPGGGDFRSEYRILSQNDEVRWVEARGRTEHDENGIIIRGYGVTIDITDRKRAENEVRESHAAFVALADLVPQMVWKCTPDGACIYFNQRWLDYTGLTMEQSSGAGWNTPFHPDDQQTAWVAWSNATRTGERYHVESRIRAADGTYRWFLMQGLPQKDGAGKILGWFGTCTDIEELKRAQETVAAQRRLTETVVNQLPCCVALVSGRDLTYHVVNPCYQAIAPGKQMIGRTVAEVWPEIDSFQDCCRLVVETGQPFHASDQATMISRAEGQPPEPAYFSWSIHRVNLPGEDDFGLLITGWETTVRKLAEEALLRSEKLATVGRMAASIAHEINNPLAATANLLFLAREVDDMPQASREYLELADAELSRIAHLTRQSLGFYRESGGPVPTPLNSLLATTVDLLKAKISGKQATVRRSWDGEVVLTAFPGELRQIFSNILANSLDAIDPGGIVVVRVSTTRGSGTASPCVRVTIADNGRGIPAGARKQIFEPFFTTKGTIGTGLGLWISKQLIDKHQGRIQMRSSTDGARRGTVVSITLPIQPQD